MKLEKNVTVIGDWGLGIGDWGLGIGDWPIPNPQSPNNIYFAKIPRNLH